MPPAGWIEADSVAPRGTKEWRQQVVRNRQAVGNALWEAQARNQLNLSDPDAVSAFLAQQGFTDEKGGGRHMRNLFMGNLPSEGFGMSSPERGISYAMEAYMPDWKRWHDRDLQRGKTRAQAEMQYPWAGAGTAGVPAPVASGQGTIAAPAPGGLSTSSSSPFYIENPFDPKKKAGLSSLVGGYGAL